MSTKFVLVGNAGVGKSTLAVRLLAGHAGQLPVVVPEPDSLGSTAPKLYGNIVDTPGLDLNEGVVSATAQSVKKLIGTADCVLVLLIDKFSTRILPVMEKFQKFARSLQGDAYKVVVIFSHKLPGDADLLLQGAVQRQLTGHVEGQCLNSDGNIVQALLAMKGMPGISAAPVPVIPWTTTTGTALGTATATVINPNTSLPIVDWDPKFIPSLKFSFLVSNAPANFHGNTNYSRILNVIIRDTLKMRKEDRAKFVRLAFMGDKVVGFVASFKVYQKGEDDLTNAIKPFTTKEGTMLAFFKKYVNGNAEHTKLLDPLAFNPLNNDYAHTCTDVVEALVGSSLLNSKNFNMHVCYESCCKSCCVGCVCECQVCDDVCERQA
jgi:hypothetical protein